ncbi:unnamed protein product, partial [Staurois parvus]
MQGPGRADIVNAGSGESGYSGGAHGGLGSRGKCMVHREGDGCTGGKFLVPIPCIAVPAAAE